MIYQPQVHSIFTDSRKSLNENDLFVALRGEKFDAAQFVATLIDKGLSHAFVNDNETNRELLKNCDQNRVTFVSDTNTFIKECGLKKLNYWKSLSPKNKVLALTGSNGKTSTKEMLASLMSVYPGKFHTTKGNLNNHLGVPFTILDMPLETEVLILEMGTNHPGEIANLCDSGLPEAGLITNIGQSHLEFFHNEDNVFIEKSELYHAISKVPDGVFLVNTNDIRLKKLKGKSSTISIGSEAGNDFVFSDQDESFKIHYKGKIFDFSCPQIIEPHNRYNMAMAVALCLSLWPELDYKSAVKNYIPPKNNRSVVLSVDNKHVYLDAYNANPSSMEVSIKGFVNHWISKKKSDLKDAMFIIGDMNELGENAPRYHEGIGKLLEGLNVKDAHFIGRYADDYLKGFPNGKKYKDRHEFISKNGRKVGNWNCLGVFIKGSRTLQLEELIDIT